MKLYASKIPVIALDIVRLLTSENDIDAENPKEVEADVEAVLKEYLRQERALTERAKDRVEAVGGGRDEVTRFKRQLAEQANMGFGGEGLSYMANQIMAMLMRSTNVDEVFSEDDIMRRKIKKVLEKHMAADDEIDKEVRDKIKNLQEGTKTWDVEYARVMEQVKRRRGVS
ncbi:MAG: DUF507 family protein [Myxococcales bacterium]|nr:DUF507 family protein [Myxococcales bacterium]